MDVKTEIDKYLAEIPEPKQSELRFLFEQISQKYQQEQLWFLDGKNADGKVVTNPNIGIGAYEILYADGTKKSFYRVGLSGNTTGISVYIMGLKDKTALPTLLKDKIGKATVTGYCIKFKTLKDIDLEVLMKAVELGMSQ